MRRPLILLAFLLCIGFALAQQSLLPRHAATLRVVTKHAGTGQAMPARVYLLKSGRPFRLSPVDAQLPLHPDLFYRERVWRQDRRTQSLEVTVHGESHVILTEGVAEFQIPAGHPYKIEAYRGFLYEPVSAEFTAEPGQTVTVELDLAPVAPQGGDWIAADDHIHLVRAPEDDPLFLQWLQAEDLAVGNFLELQRQQHAAMQYGFGPKAEARAAGYSIRSGQESRSRFYGHVLGLGPREMVQPLSIGLEYANSREAYPYPGVLFERIRQQGGLAGFAHFYGSQPNSSLLMNLAHGELDFVELFQFGELHTEPWYELLNAGFRVVGLAGSDFPANTGRLDPWPRTMPLLGPERAMVQAPPGESAYAAWAAGVQRGAVTVTNGPLLQLSANGQEPGATASWDGDSLSIEGRAEAWFHRPLHSLEVVVNGEVVRRVAAGGALDYSIEVSASSWVAARVRAENSPGEPEIRAHTNPVYFLKEGEPVYFAPARQALAARWRDEAAYYRSAPLAFAEPTQRRALLQRVAETERILSTPPVRRR